MALIVIDLDGTICSEEKTFSRSMAKPKPGAKEVISELKKTGNTIIIYSARSWQEYEMTVSWLNANEIIFDQLVLGKPIGDYWIDDRAIKFHSWDHIRSEVLKNG